MELEYLILQISKIYFQVIFKCPEYLNNSMFKKVLSLGDFFRYQQFFSNICHCNYYVSLIRLKSSIQKYRGIRCIPMAFGKKKGKPFYASCTKLKEYGVYGYYCQSPLEYLLLPSDKAPPLLVMRVNSRCTLCHKSPNQRQWKHRYILQNIT